MPTQSIIKYFIFGFLQLLVITAQSQHIYVQSWQETEGGWIVSPEGETVFEIPFGWRPQLCNAAMAEVTAWPMLMQWKKWGEVTRYAFLNEDMEWETISGYQNVFELGAGRFKGVLPQSNLAVLLNQKGERVNQDTLRDILPFEAPHALAIASERMEIPNAQSGLIDTFGRWIIPPSCKRIFPLRQNRYLGYNTSPRVVYLLKTEQTSTEVHWDTLLDISANNWHLNYDWQFDKSGRSWVCFKPGLYQAIDLEGSFLGDTIAATEVKPFSEGRAIVSSLSGHRFVNENGHFQNSRHYAHLLDYANGLALVEDSLTHYFGYLNREGSWAIEPSFCYATSFRNGLAVVAPAIAENCSTLTRTRGGDRKIPASMYHARRIRAYQLIDTSGSVIWTDSCQALYLPTAGVLGINYSHNQFSQAIALKWLKGNRYWISPNFTVVRWQQLDSLNGHTIKRINLGIRRFDQLIGQQFDLPEDFVDRLSEEKLQQLELLNIGSHRISPTAYEAIFALPNLLELSFNYSDVTTLPSSIKQLRNLEILDLSGTKLTSLPKAVYRMKQLQKIIIIDTDLPAETIPRLRKALPDTEVVFKREW